MSNSNDFRISRTTPNSQGPRDFGVFGQRDPEFRSRRVIDTVSKKKGDFSETRSDVTKPEVFYWYTAGNTNYYNYLDVRVTSKSRKKVPLDRTVVPGGTGAAYIRRSSAPLLGNGLAFTVCCNDGVDGYALPSCRSWPAFFPTEGNVTQRLLNESTTLGSTISYANTHMVTGMVPFEHAPQATTSGFDSALGGWSFGFGYTYYSNLANKTGSRIPVFYHGNSVNFALTAATLPYAAGRDNVGFNVCRIGKGMLQALMLVQDDAALTRVDPYLLTSSDFGKTWSSSAAGFITPHLVLLPADEAHPRPYFYDVQTLALAKYTFITYIGQGFSLLVIPNGALTSTLTGAYYAMAFVGRYGSGYTRVSWPCDLTAPLAIFDATVDHPADWFVDENAYPTNSVYASSTFLGTGSADSASSLFGFGDGCFAIQVTSYGTYRFMLLWTTDYGASWKGGNIPNKLSAENVPSFDPAVLRTTSTRTGDPAGFFVRRPYKSADDPGEIYLIWIGNGATEGQMHLLRTDGLFTSYTYAGKMIETGGASFDTGSLQINAYESDIPSFAGLFAVNGRYCIDPAYPNDFGA